VYRLFGAAASDRENMSKTSMSPNTSYDRTANGVMIAGYEYGPDVFGDGVPPHALEFLWDAIDLSEVARCFDAGEEYGSCAMRDEIANALAQYEDMSPEEKMKLHDQMLVNLRTQKMDAEDKVRAYEQIVPRLFQVLGNSSHEKVFTDQIQKILDDETTRLCAIASDIDAEEDWCLEEIC
jgi:hypothetical protein